MTVYAGEKPYICHWAKHPLTKEQLTGGDVAVVITIWDVDNTVLIDDAVMVYDAELTSDETIPQVGGWYYVWESPPGAPGAYQARITVVEFQAWEYKTIRLRRDKAPV